MKILHVINSLNLGGAEKLLVDSLPIYKEKGYDVTLLLLNSKQTFFFDALRLKTLPYLHQSLKLAYIILFKYWK
ncbi:hypothetical protein [Algibacter lectus]|uniref:hypothetical protein n=1 Tax=Algibacter lectus TaxID=221126 RepID=UPI000694BA8A|nr:hypothetical protein [Algibacter lectus]